MTPTTTMQGTYKKNVSLHRNVLFAVVAFTAALLGYAYYTQYVEYLIPCPLCITQRFFYFLVGLFALISSIRVRSILWQKVGSAMMFLAALAGLLTASRQVWLQFLPPEKVPECGPGLHYWLENEPALETLKLLFKGDGNCAEVHWTFLGLSMAGWSLIMFSGLMITSIWLFRCRGRITNSVGV